MRDLACAPAGAAARRAARGVALAATLVATLALPALAQGRGGPPLSLQSARTADFTATEGTWISLDVSPDGQMIVFDLLGDLYTMPITGGRASPLLTGMAFQSQPRFSPDGESITFVSDASGGDNLWTMRLDKTDTTQISQGNNSSYVSPEWTPDGEYIVVTQGASLTMFHHERRAPIALGQQPGGFKLGPAFGPEGDHIWFAAGSPGYNARLPKYQLYRYDRETGASTLMSNGYGGGMRPAISPDGRWLIYGSRYNADTGLRKRDLVTGEEEWLAYPVQRDEQESLPRLDLLPGYAFTPDGSAIIASYGGKIWRVPMDGGAQTEIAFEVPVELEVGPEVKFAYTIDTTAMVTASQIRSPVTSPDGDQVAFTAFDRLWIKDLPDGDARRLTDADVGEFHPQWSPDGQWIGYVTWDDADGGHVMKVPLAGGAATQLTRTAAIYWNPAWAPDGQRMVASRGAARDLMTASGIFFPQASDLVWVPATGGDATLISPAGFRDYMHFVDGVNDRIYAYSPAEGIVSFRWDGTDVKSHMRVLGRQGVPGVMDPHPTQWEFLPRRPFPWKNTSAPRSAWGQDDPIGPAPPTEPGGMSPAGLAVMSPVGDRAFVQFGNDIFVVDLAEVGETPPTIALANLGASPVPVRKLTQVGGEFPAWTRDGDALTFAMGHTLFTYDIDHVETEEAQEEETAHARALFRARAIAVSDTLGDVREELDSLEKAVEEAADSVDTSADETTIEGLKSDVTRLRADSVQVVADSLIARADSIRAAAQEVADKAAQVRGGDEDILADTTDTYEAAELEIEARLPRDVPRGTVALTGARIVTMRDVPDDTTGAPEVIENGVVVVKDNKIVDVGAADSVEIPEQAERIDMQGKTIVPGFIDTHYHTMWLVPEIHPQEVWQYLTTLSYGVTTTRDPQTAFTDVLSYDDRVATGDLIGPRTYSTGPGVFSSENIRDLDHAKDILRRYAEYYDTKTIKMYMSGNRQQRQWVIQAAHELEIMPTTEGGIDFKLELTHAIDGYPGIEHSLPIVPMYSDIVELFETSQTTNSPTLLVTYGGPWAENWFYATENAHDDAKLNMFAPHDNIDARTRRRGPGAGDALNPNPGQVGWFLEEEYVFPRHGEWIKDMLEGDARVGVGSHGQLQGLGFHWELWAMGAGGASAHDMLRAATILGAEAIGLGGEIGSIEEGKYADLVILNSNPLDNLRNTTDISHVMKDGRLFDGMTLDEMYPEQRPLERRRRAEEDPTNTAAGIGR